MSALPYVKFYPSDFLAAAAFIPRRLRGIYAYLLILQADKGTVTMSVDDLADHLDCPPDDVAEILDLKFDFRADSNGWMNSRMAEERDRAMTIIENKREGAAKARAAKESPPRTPPKKRDPEPEPEPEPASTTDIKLDIKVDTKKVAARPASCVEAEAYAAEIGLPSSDGAAFFDAKEGNGWKNGKNPIRDWKATMRTWKANGWLASQQRNGNAANGRPRAEMAPPPTTKTFSMAEIDRDLERLLAEKNSKTKP